MYVDLRVPPIEKRHSEPFTDSLSIPQISTCLSAPDLSLPQQRLFQEFCFPGGPAHQTPPVPPRSSASRSSPSPRSGASSTSVSPKRSPSGDCERKYPTVVVDVRRSSSAKRKGDEPDGWLEFYHRRVPSASRRGSVAQLLSAGGPRCRSFSITPKGSVVNLGDIQIVDSSRRRSTGSCNDSSDIQLLTQRVRLVGSAGVGKSCLIEQFKDGFANSVNEFGYLEIVTSPPPSVQCSVETQSTRLVLDGEEFEVDFDELLPTEVNIGSISQSDAIVIVYSITDSDSLQAAEDTLKYLRMMFGYGKVKRKSAAAIKHALHPRPMILAGNKADLARKRTVSTEAGRSLAKRFDCRFLETSACIGHNVDELLVEILKEIRVKHRSSSLPGWSLNLPSVFVACADTTPLNVAASTPKPANAAAAAADMGTTLEASASRIAAPMQSQSSGRTFCFKARGLLQRFWTRCDSGRTRSCEDLDVL